MEDSVFRMQQAARRRVLLSQEHARRIMEQHCAETPCEPSCEAPCAPPPKLNCNQPATDTPGGEQTLLLVLALFLLRSGAPTELLLALLYLML